jgi:hypothetical protein
MPGAIRFYKSNAERQRAYRKRKQEEVEQERLLAEEVSIYAWVLWEAVRAASGAGGGDPVARKVYRPDPIDTLRALVDHFHDQAGTPASGRPWRETAESEAHRAAVAVVTGAAAKDGCSARRSHDRG